MSYLSIVSLISFCIHPSSFFCSEVFHSQLLSRSEYTDTHTHTSSCSALSGDSQLSFTLIYRPQRSTLLFFAIDHKDTHDAGLTCSVFVDASAVAAQSLCLFHSFCTFRVSGPSSASIAWCTVAAGGSFSYSCWKLSSVFMISFYFSRW